MRAKGTTSPIPGQVALLAPLAPLEVSKSAKSAKSATVPALEKVVPLEVGGDAPPDMDAVTLAYDLGWTLRQIARALGLSYRAVGVLAEDGNLADVVHGHLEREPDVLRDYIARMAECAGGWGAMIAFSAWRPYGPPIRHEERRLPWNR
jgi:hypothetical protein